MHKYAGTQTSLNSYMLDNGASYEGRETEDESESNFISNGADLGIKSH